MEGGPLCCCCKSECSRECRRVRTSERVCAPSPIHAHSWAPMSYAAPRLHHNHIYRSSNQRVPHPIDHPFESRPRGPHKKHTKALSSSEAISSLPTALANPIPSACAIEQWRHP